MESCAVVGRTQKPEARVSFQSEVLEGRPVLIIEVPAGKDVPCAVRAVIYRREGDANRRADAAAIGAIVMRRQVELERRERRFSLAGVDTGDELDEVRRPVAAEPASRRRVLARRRRVAAAALGKLRAEP